MHSGLLFLSPQLGRAPRLFVLLWPLLDPLPPTSALLSSRFVVLMDAQFASTRRSARH